MKYDVVDFIDDMMVSFGFRHESEESEEKWTDMMVDELKSFNGDVLKEAVREFRRTRKIQKFPTPAECIEVCVNIARRKQAMQPQELQIEGEMRPGDAVRAYIAGAKTYDMLVATKPDVVVRAAKEDCMGVLRAFVIRKGRLPNSLDEKIIWHSGEEAHSIRDEKRRVDAGYEHCVRNEVAKEDEGDWQKLGGIGVIAALRRLGDSMLKRREDMRQQILGQ